MKLQKDIPILLLEEITQQGLNVTRYHKSDDQDLLFKAPHRDDHYIFVFQLQGKSRIMVDFKEIEVHGCSILCILPGQVHQGLYAQNVEAFFIAIETALIKDSMQYIFEERVPLKGSVALENDDAIMLQQSLDLLMNVLSRANENSLRSEISRSLTDACIGIIAHAFDIVKDLMHGTLTRPIIITKQFRRLLSQSFKTERTPSGYAKLLNISASYMNEVVKQVTGYSASYWIQKQIIIEAKRILFYTDLSVKEISGMLGFEDQHYFSRFFTRASGMSPVSFRHIYRK